MTVISDIRKDGSVTSAFDIDRIRADFPILSQTVYDKPFVYLDSAASAQKPRQVIDAITRTYETEYANVHRGVHFMSQKATDTMEAAREKVGASEPDRRRRDYRFRDGASFQHRPLADDRGADRCCPQGRAGRR